MLINAANTQCTSEHTVRANLINKEEKLLAVEKFLSNHFSQIKSKKLRIA